MARPVTSRPTLAWLAALLVAAVSAAGCVSVPSGGPVQSYPVTQGPDAQSQQNVQIQPQPPGAGWSPERVVQGFLTASASFGSYQQVALQYLTPLEQQVWAHPTWSAVVYKTGPSVSAPIYHPSTAKNATMATVRIAGRIQAVLTGNDNYSVPSASAHGEASYAPEPFQLQKVGGQWRISSAPLQLLLTSDSFANDYQLRNLYFFDPTGRFLVPDPVYVPLGARSGDPMNVLVRGLITPPDDWLYGATKTALPKGTKISDIALGATAVVDLTGAAIAKAAKANDLTMQQISAQLLSTLSTGTQAGSSEQAVQSVEVEVNGQPWIPPDSQGNPVQHTLNWHQALGASSVFYYVDNAGYLIGRPSTGGQPVRRAKIGTGYSQIAVSPDGNHVAALRDGVLYTGLVAGPLARRDGGYVAMSWDINDDLWASTGTQIVMFRGSANARQPLGEMVPVDVMSTNPIVPPFTQLRVAPDGVRVAIVQNGDTLTFGAISGQQSANPRITLSLVQESPLSSAGAVPGNANFTALAWYGPDNVITLAEPGPAVTEYSASDGTSTSIPAEPGMQTIAASSGQPLIAGLPNARMASDANPTGSWTSLSDGGSSPTYPG